MKIDVTFNWTDSSGKRRQIAVAELDQAELRAFERASKPCCNGKAPPSPSPSRGETPSTISAILRDILKQLDA